LPDRLVAVLAFLFSEASKLRSSESDFKDSLVSFALSERTNALLFQAFSSANARIRELLETVSVQTPHYQNLEYRVDVELASRSLMGQHSPVWLMKLTTLDSDGVANSQMLQTDATNLSRLYEELSMAFGEERAGYVRRVARNIK
jgi:hypothetical protein